MPIDFKTLERSDELAKASFNLGAITTFRINSLLFGYYEAGISNDYATQEKVLDYLYAEVNALTPEPKQKVLEDEYVKIKNELLERNVGNIPSMFKSITPALSNSEIYPLLHKLYIFLINKAQKELQLLMPRGADPRKSALG